VSESGPPPTELEIALAELVRELESSDYRNSAGVLAHRTSAFLCAKALVDLTRSINRRPWWRT